MSHDQEGQMAVAYKLTTLDNLDGSQTSVSGNNPQGGLIMDAAGNLFGTTSAGGAFGDGTVFEIAWNGSSYASAPAVLATFNNASGFHSVSSLTLDAAGNLIGTAAFGGTNFSGTVFEIAKTSTGYASATTIASFPTNASNAPFFPVDNLIIDAAGNLFGTTEFGGIGTDAGGSGYGTVFEIAKTANGYASAPTILAQFQLPTTGVYPTGNLVMDSAGNLLGTTSQGGGNGKGTVFEIAKTANGYSNTITTLVDFNGSSAFDLGGSYGDTPLAGLIIDKAGNLWGTTDKGGLGANQSGTSYNQGEIFEIAKTAAGYASVATTVVTFTGSNGANPDATLFLDAAGNVFGTTKSGGATNGGTVFELTSYVPLTVSVSGTAQEGQTLTATANESVSYQWQVLVGNNWTNIGGATGATYLVQQIDDGLVIRVQVTDSAGITAFSPETNAVLDAAGNQPVYETASQTTIGSGLFQYVFGLATDTTVNGGVQNIYPASFYAGGSNPEGRANITILNAGGIQFDWGSATNTTINDGKQFVWGTADVTTISSGVQSIASGGSASSTTIKSGGEQDVAGTAFGTEIAGGKQLVYGTADLTGIDSAGLQYVFGSVTNTTVNSGGDQNIYAGGTASGTRLNAGGTEVDWGTATNTTINGGSQYVWGTATNTTILSGLQDVESGGTANGTTINSGGEQDVYSGGTSGTNSAGGGSTTINGGKQYVWGTASNTTISSGLQYVESGGTTNGTTINSGGEQDVLGTANTATINNGGNQYVWGAANSTILNGGKQFVEAGATAFNTGSVAGGGDQYVYAGGVANNAGFYNGNQFVYGTANTTQVETGSFQYVFGIATGTTVADLGGGQQNIYAGGMATGTTLHFGGIQVDWGAADTTTVESGAFQYVWGTATNTSINGGNQYVWGTASNTTISSGVQYVASGGTANSTTIDGGWTEHVFAGGAAHDVTFGGPNATLALDKASALTGTISGWQVGDHIDLGDILFNQPGTTLGFTENAAITGGTLTVSDGSHVASMALLGQYMASSFALSSDGHGGTFVTDPAVAAQATIATPHHA
jgi:autotransporter passenger strand-loop-strand repeat protein/uncharacterized repeat protein (TIGR03803 family)